MFSRAAFSKYYLERESRTKKYEDAYEAIFKHNFYEHLDALLSYQYIANPSARSDIKDAQVIVARLLINL